MAKKPVTKTFNIFNEVYGVNLLVISNCTESQMHTLLKRRFNITVSDHYKVTGANTLSGSVLDFDVWPFHVLWLGDKDDTNGRGSKNHQIAKLSHEVFHHVLRVCAAKNIPTYPNIDNLVMDEPAAYLMEFYMRQILQKLWK